MPETPNPKSREPLPPPTCVTPCDLDYAELDVTSNFSFLRGASHPDELIYAAAEMGYRAIAITDLHTLAGVVRAHAAAKSCGMKLIIGSRIPLTDGPELLVWATDRAAYGRLCRLLTLGKRRVQKGNCELSVDDFVEHGEGLLAAACGVADQDLDSLHYLRDALGNRLSLTISRVYDADDETYLGQMLDLSRKTHIPLLATNVVHYHDPARRMLQDVLTCVRHKCTIHDAGFKLFPNGERYLKSPAQMHRLFEACPQAIRRGIDIAEQCSFKLDELRYEYPREIVPDGLTTLEYLIRCTWTGAALRYPSGVPEQVKETLEKELAFIKERKLEAYFLTVSDLVQFARGCGILCQGRGSAANSVVCYCLGVTSVDPIKVNLLFERFLSTARDEPPDIDVDFEHERREEVIQYVYKKYGRHRAGMTATLITYRGRSAVRDIGKAMGLSLDILDSLAKRLDWWHRGSLTDEQLRQAGVDPRDSTIRATVALSTELLGFPRHLGQHTGGMVISDGPLCELVPIENASMPDRTVVEWDKNDIEELKLVKVDALALGMLTCISKAFRLLEKSDEATKRRYDLHTLPQDDPLVYDMICDADTVGVFQIESRAQMSMLPRLRPRTFYDIVIEVAIVRPGPIQGNMVHPYLRRRNGEEQVTYPSEALRGVLQKTLGVPLFQEQAMKVAMVAASFTANEADQLRRAMAAWRRSGAILGFHKKIIEGMIKNGYERDFAERTFEQIQGFGEYGFPESHSASFALLVYVSAWLKRHHPAAFCCAILNSQPMGFYAPAQLVRDAKEHGVTVLPVDVNHSEWDCTLPPLPGGEGSGEGRTFANQAISPPLRGGEKSIWGTNGPAVRLGFRQIKGFREELGNRIVELREQAREFASIDQFQAATNLPVKAIKLLAEADAFGSMGLTRRQSIWQALKLKGDSAPLFDSSTSSVRLSVSSSLLPTMPLGQEIMTDYSTTRLSLKQHPLTLARETLTSNGILTARDANALPHGTWVKVAGLVLIRQRPGTASGIVFITLEDETGVVNLIVRPNVFDRYHAAARHAGLLQCDGYIERQGQVVHVMAKRLIGRDELIRGFELSSRDFH